MQHQLELYETVSLNLEILTDAERKDILKAQLALALFARAMRAFRERTAKASAIARAA